MFINNERSLIYDLHPKTLPECHFNCILLARRLHNAIFIHFFLTVRNYFYSQALPTEQGIESFAKALKKNRLCITFVNAKGEVQKIESMEELERLNDRFEMFECYLEDQEKL